MFRGVRRRRRSSSSIAEPVPYQPGSITRDWLQAITQGIARRSEIDDVGLRDVGPTADVQRTDLADRGGLQEVLHETVCLVDQFGVGTLRTVGQFVENFVGRAGRVAEPLDVEQGRLQGGRQQGLQVALGHLRLGVFGGDHLALLGQPQRAVHRSRRLSEDGFIAWPSTAADRAAATVEEPQPNSGFACRFDEVEFGPVERPVGGQVAAVLVGVGVAEHDLLAVAAGAHDALVDRKVKCRFENRCAAVQVVDRLEQRDDADRAVRLVCRRRRAVRIPSAGCPASSRSETERHIEMM